MNPLEPPPNSLEAEQGVVGSMLISPTDVIPMMTQRLSAGDFVDYACRTCFELTAKLWHEAQAVDVILLTNALRAASKLEHVGGPSFVAHLFTSTPTAANAERYAETVKKGSANRKIWLVCTRLQSEAIQPGADPGEMAAQLTALIADLGTSQNEPPAWSQNIRSALDRYEEAYENRNKPKPGVIPTGIAELDGYLPSGGLRPGSFFVVAAETSFGKSALALQFGVEGAIRCNQGVLIVSYEMDAEELTDRIVALETGVPSFKLANGFFNEADFARLAGAATKLSKAGIHLRDEVSHWTVDEIASESRAIKARHGLGLVIVDYLQLANPRASKGRQINREREVADMSRALKSLAKELRVPVVALSQLTDGKLRESRAIGHDANVVLLIGESLDKQTKEPRDDWRELHLQKNRGGPRDKVITLPWNGPLMRFG